MGVITILEVELGMRSIQEELDLAAQVEAIDEEMEEIVGNAGIINNRGEGERQNEGNNQNG